MSVGWIFDLDGTLTRPMHDFSALKRSLGLPSDRDVLGGIATRPAEEQARLHEAVKQWEADHARTAQPAEGAEALLDSLAAHPVAILTRNTRETALNTLEQIGLAHYFEPSLVLGRNCAAPKPAPDGILAILSRWAARPDATVMVGDYVHDLQAGRAAGSTAIWIDPERTGQFSAEADLTVQSLHELVGYSPR